MAFPLEISFRKIATLDYQLGREWGVLINELQKHKTENIEVSEARLTFRNPISRVVMNTNLMLPIDKGSIELIELGTIKQLVYRISLKRILLISLVLSILLMILTREWWIGPLTFVFIGGGNWVTAVIRHYLFFSRTVKKINILATTTE